MSLHLSRPFYAGHYGPTAGDRPTLLDRARHLRARESQNVQACRDVPLDRFFIRRRMARLHAGAALVTRRSPRLFALAPHEIRAEQPLRLVSIVHGATKSEVLDGR